MPDMYHYLEFSKSYSNVRKQTLNRYTTSKCEWRIYFVLELFAK